MIETFKDNIDDVQKMLESIDNLRHHINFHELDFRTQLKKVTFDNPISFSGLNEEINVLTEGLIKTYPIEKTVNYVKNYFNLDEKHIQIIDNCICVVIPDVGENINIMKKVLNLCGYYPATINVYGIYYQTIQFKPKFQKKVENKLEKIVKDDI